MQLRRSLTPEDFFQEMVEVLDAFESGWDELYEHDDVLAWVYEQWPIDAPIGMNLLWWARSCLSDLEAQATELWEDGSADIQPRRARG
jgi:hypothetical protein